MVTNNIASSILVSWLYTVHCMLRTLYAAFKQLNIPSSGPKFPGLNQPIGTDTCFSLILEKLLHFSSFDFSIKTKIIPTSPGGCENLFIHKANNGVIGTCKLFCVFFFY